MPCFVWFLVVKVLLWEKANDWRFVVQLLWKLNNTFCKRKSYLTIHTLEKSIFLGATALGKSFLKKQTLQSLDTQTSWDPLWFALFHGCLAPLRSSQQHIHAPLRKYLSVLRTVQNNSKPSVLHFLGCLNFTQNANVALFRAIWVTYCYTYKDTSIPRARPK